MKRIILSLLICASFYNSNAQKGGAKQQPLINYNNTEYKIKMQYPKSWEITDTISGAVFFIFTPSDDNDQFRENLTLSYEDISQNPTTLKEFVDGNLIGIKDGSTILDFKQVSAKYFIWNGKQAYEINYTGKIADVDFPLVWCQRFVINKDKAYILTYSAEGSKKDIFSTAAKLAMNSLKFY
ncbi:hypothetical protein LK994_10830 [Ferruginibacter lapsinanis]|uniref:hypothetical protein n=1 Tax=Ferruginibacter lapsinanis TaxID=563172 RepID=UPI001E3C85BE|nr:hypothetical protein [Ferruginibacter lapsinanis]UEG49125.1 hypothetical protein LK994_10830 [Ferruginibacter lapsinanis]